MKWLWKKTDRVELDIQGMTCDGCARHVKAALERVEGVKKADIPSWQKGRATVSLSTPVPVERLIAAVEQAGYRATVKHANGRNPAPDSGHTPDGYDLVVIGTGGGGMAAAIRAAEMGKRVAIIEKGTIGGTCVNIGCVPSKMLIRAARNYHQSAHPRFAGLHIRAEGINWSELIRQKNHLVEALRQQKYIDVLKAYENITLIQGEASLTPEGHVVVDGQQTLRTQRVVIATGARPKVLPLEGLDRVPVLTSTDLLSLPEQPASLLVIGGRAVALELGQAMARLGTRVTILQRSPRLVPEHDPDISEGIRSALEAEGITVVTGATPKAIRQQNGKKVIVADVHGEVSTFEADAVLMAVGRVPNTETLNLEAAGIRTDARGFIEVDAYLQTSRPGVYAVGDVTPLPKLVYVAAAAGGLAAQNAFSSTPQPLDLAILPEVIFTDPQIATVGMTEDQARQAGYRVKTSTLPLEAVPRALSEFDTRGFIKLVADETTGRLLGAHVLAPEGGEIIQTAALAMEFGRRADFTVDDLRTMLFPYLTQVEGIKLAAQTFEKDVAMLSCCAG